MSMLFTFIRTRQDKIFCVILQIYLYCILIDIKLIADGGGVVALKLLLNKHINYYFVDGITFLLYTKHFSCHYHN